MSHITDRLHAQAIVIPVKQENRVKQITMHPDRNMLVTLNSGETFTVSENDKLFQAFIVYLALYN